MKGTTLRTLPELFRAMPDPPLDRAALVLACDAYPRLDVGEWLARLDDLAAPLAERAMNVRRVEDQAALLGTYVYDELGFHGDEEHYYDPRNSYLHEVIERRTGIPISLAVLLVSLGRRAGMTVEGVGFPGHFLVRLGGTDGLYLDPFFHARILARPALDDLAKRALGSADKLTREHLAPVSARAVIARMLNNLKGIYEKQRDHARALVVCDRLVDLIDQPELRRDRALHAIALGANAAAVDDLEHYLLLRKDAPDVPKMREALEQARKAPRRGTLQ